MQWWLRSSVAGIALAIAGIAEAQYFGRNKVLYEKFDYKMLTTDHFDIYYYPEEEAAVQLAARMAERWYARLSKVLRHELSGRQPLILYAAHPHFQQTNALPGEVGEGTGGVTEMLKRRIVLPFAGGMAETDHVLGHVREQLDEVVDVPGAVHPHEDEVVALGEDVDVHLGRPVRRHDGGAAPRVVQRAWRELRSARHRQPRGSA